MANPIARLGDTSSHGGTITTSAARTKVEGHLVARVGDTLNCPIHGPNAITTGSPKFSVEGALVARSGSVTVCGAVIIGGAAKTFCG
jgi:uncharacterized Zn-binding protein involved in type VI secretion